MPLTVPWEDFHVPRASSTTWKGLAHDSSHHVSHAASTLRVDLRMAGPPTHLWAELQLSWNVTGGLLGGGCLGMLITSEYSPEQKWPGLNVFCLKMWHFACEDAHSVLTAVHLLSQALSEHHVFSAAPAAKVPWPLLPHHCCFPCQFVCNWK